MGIFKSPEACVDRKKEKKPIFLWQVDLKYRHCCKDEVIIDDQREPRILKQEGF